MVHPRYVFYNSPAKLSNLQSSRSVIAQSTPDDSSVEASSASVICQFIRHRHPWVNSTPYWRISILLLVYIEHQAPRYQGKDGGTSLLKTLLITTTKTLSNQSTHDSRCLSCKYEPGFTSSAVSIHVPPLVFDDNRAQNFDLCYPHCQFSVHSFVKIIKLRPMLLSKPSNFYPFYCRKCHISIYVVVEK